MAKREIVGTIGVQKDEIMAKIKELNELVALYFSQYEKATPGQKSIGDSAITFVENCAKKVPVYPEILSGTFNQEDFLVKAGGVSDFFAFNQKMAEAISGWETSVKICKTDAMYYANEYYGIIQREAVRNNKYKPTLEELTPFYKRSNKTADSKTKTTSTATPTTTQAPVPTEN